MQVRKLQCACVSLDTEVHKTGTVERTAACQCSCYSDSCLCV